MPGSGSPSEAPPATPTLRQKAWGWVRDYAYAAYWIVRGLLARGTADELLHPPGGHGSPILLVPGVYESWRFMQPVAEHFYRAGHPVHVLDKLGYNTGAIPAMAEIVTEYLREADLHDVTLVAHSKGGLIAKYSLADEETKRRVRHVVTINTPFLGSRWAYLFLLPSVRMFTPRGPVIRQLMQNLAVNRMITSLYSVFDPHIPETSRLDGAENVVLPTIGHFRPIADRYTLTVIADILAPEESRPGGEAS